LPHSDDKLSMKETLQSIIERFRAVQHSWSQVPEGAFQREQVWYAGLAVSPAEFTDQLSKLQGSLQRENSRAKFSSPTVTT
jgi:hypothetical protein